MLSRLRNWWLLQSYMKKGLKLGRDVRVIGEPNFGSEPWLIEVGDHVTISDQVAFITHDGGTWVFRHVPLYAGLQRFGRIVIEDNCFIGARSIILPDVTIGSNSVVGAGSVVTKSVPPNSVVAGDPARHICTYEEYIERAAPRSRHYPPDVAGNPKKLRQAHQAELALPDQMDTRRSSAKHTKLKFD